MELALVRGAPGRAAAERCRSARSPSWTAWSWRPATTSARGPATRPRTPKFWPCAMPPHSVGGWRLSDVTLVVTLEPCPMCAGALVAARVGRIVFGATDPRAGACGTLYNLCADPRLNHEVDVTGGVAAAACRELLTSFFAERRTDQAAARPSCLNGLIRTVSLGTPARSGSVVPRLAAAASLALVDLARGEALDVGRDDLGGLAVDFGTRTRSSATPPRRLGPSARSGDSRARRCDPRRRGGPRVVMPSNLPFTDMRWRLIHWLVGL